MVKRQLQRISLGSLFFIIGAISIFAQPKTMVSGKVISKEKQEVVDFATVYLKGKLMAVQRMKKVSIIFMHRQGNTRWLFRL